MMRLIRLVAAWTGLWLAVFVSARTCPGAELANAKGQWVVVTAPALRASIQPLCEHRRREGMRVVVIDASDTLSGGELRTGRADALRGKVRDFCRGWRGPSYVLLVGAATVDGLEKPEQYVVPALRGTVARMTGQPTDNGYGCLDDKLLPTVAVGRFPARTQGEARAMVAKTLAWEKDERPGVWKRRLTVLAGAPSYNPVVDAMVEKLAISHIGRVHPCWSGRAIYRNPASSFHLPDDRLRKQAVGYLGEGQAVIMYIGHSVARGFWDNRFSRKDWASIKIERGAGIFATTGCHGCQLCGTDGEGYGLAAVRNRHGPVAVIGANGESLAAMGLLLTEGLLRHLPAPHESPRLGDLWLAMKKHLAAGWINPIVYRALDAVDGSPDTPQATQRLEHLEMYLLLGDPAIRFPSMPAKVSMEIEGNASPGARLKVTGRVPSELAAAAGRLTLERTLISEPVGLEPVPPPAEAENLARVLQANHEKSNRFVLKEVKIKLNGRAFESELELPAEAPWPKFIVRLYLATDKSEGMAVQVVRMEKPGNQVTVP